MSPELGLFSLGICHDVTTGKRKACTIPSPGTAPSLALSSCPEPCSLPPHRPWSLALAPSPCPPEHCPFSLVQPVPSPLPSPPWTLCPFTLALSSPADTPALHGLPLPPGCWLLSHCPLPFPGTVPSSQPAPPPPPCPCILLPISRARASPRPLSLARTRRPSTLCSPHPLPARSFFEP